MGTILIDKLLSACVKQGASDLHITVGQPPVLRLTAGCSGSRPRSGAGRHAGADEEHHAGPLPAGIPGNGQRRLRLRVRRRGPLPRVGLPAARQRGDGVAADSHQDVVDGRAGRAADLQEPDCAAARAGDRHGPDRLGQDDVARGDGRLSQRQLRPPHHHDRRPDRVPARSQEVARSISARWAST